MNEIKMTEIFEKWLLEVKQFEASMLLTKPQPQEYKTAVDYNKAMHIWKLSYIKDFPTKPDLNPVPKTKCYSIEILVRSGSTSHKESRTLYACRYRHKNLSIEFLNIDNDVIAIYPVNSTIITSIV
jgi:hypothetical protein